MTATAETVDLQAAKTGAAIAFVLGFLLGYKVKEWRLRFAKFRRDRLAKKLADAQKQVDALAPAF